MAPIRSSSTGRSHHRRSQPRSRAFRTQLFQGQVAMHDGFALSDRALEPARWPTSRSAVELWMARRRRRRRQSLNRRLVATMDPCPRCLHGSGEDPTSGGPCEACGGTGYADLTRQIEPSTTLMTTRNDLLYGDHPRLDAACIYAQHHIADTDGTIGELYLIEHDRPHPVAYLDWGRCDRCRKAMVLEIGVHAELTRQGIARLLLNSSRSIVGPGYAWATTGRVTQESKALFADQNARHDNIYENRACSHLRSGLTRNGRPVVDWELTEAVHALDLRPHHQ